MQEDLKEKLIACFKAKMFDSSGRFCSPRARIRFFDDDEEVFQFVKESVSCGVSISEMVYKIINNVENTPKCEFCDLKTSYASFKGGYHKTCGSIACLRSGYGKNPHIPTELERAAISKRMISHNPMFNKDTCKRMIDTQRQKNNGTLPINSPESLQKSLDSRYDKYNTFSPKSNLFKPKKYLMPSGKTEWVQGYENKALDLLLSQNNEEDVVICGKKHKFKYSYNGKTKTYYPDIFIPSRNCYIEVKSKYTYDVSIEKNLLKRKAVENAGFKFEFWILDADASLTIS